MAISRFLRQKRVAFLLLAALLTIFFASGSFAAEKKDEPVFFKDATFMFPSGSSVAVNWVLPPVSKTVPDACFSIDDSGAPILGYDRKILMAPYSGNVMAVDGGFSGFTHLENGVLLLAKGNDIGVLARLKEKTENEKGIPLMGFQPIISVPVRRCDVFGSFGNTVYCAGPNEMSGEYELYLLRSEKDVGLKELVKLLTSHEPITAVTGDDAAVFVAIGRRIVRIEKKDKTVSLYYLHPSAEVKGLACSAQSGLFISTGEVVIFAGSKGVLEVMLAPGHQIAMRQGNLYVFFPKSLALFVVEHLDDLNRFNLAVESIAAAPRMKSPLLIPYIRFFESSSDYPYAGKRYALSFERTTIHSIVSEFKYQRAASSKGKKQHTVVVSWFEPTGGLLTSETFTITLPSKVASGTTYTKIGRDGKGGYEKSPAGKKWALGDDALGLRYPGKYRMTVQVDGAPAGEDFFTITGKVQPADALAYDDLEAMQRLLGNGLDPNEKDEKGFPLLNRAVEYSTPRMVALLLEKGANPNLLDSYNISPLAQLFKSERNSEWREKADLLISHGAKIDVGRLTDEKKIYYLIEKGAPKHMIELYGKAMDAPILEKAVRSDSYCTDKIVASLIKSGASPNAWNAGKSPLAASIAQNTPECVKQLLGNGALTNEVREERGIKQSALFLALRGYIEDEKKNDSPAMMKRVRIVRMLLEKGAELSPKEGRIIFEGSAASLVGKDVCYKAISANDDALESAAKSKNHEIRQLAIRRYVDKTRETTVSAADMSDLQKAIRYCNTARSLYETMDTQVRGNIMPEIPLYCGLLEHRIGGMQEQANADLSRYLALVPEADNAAKIRALLDEMKK